MLQKRDCGFDTDVREQKRRREAAHREQGEGAEDRFMVDDIVCFLAFTYNFATSRACALLYHTQKSMP